MIRTARHMWTGWLVPGFLAVALLPQTAAGQCNTMIQPPATKLSVKDQTAGANDRLEIHGDFVLPVSNFASLNPSGNGATVKIEDANATVIVQQVLPAGAYDPATKIGWSENAGQTVWRFRNNPPGSPTTNGIRRLILTDRNGTQPNQVRLRVIGTHGNYPLSGVVLPLKATVTVDNTSGDCGETNFLATECTSKTTPGVSGVNCKQ